MLRLLHQPHFKHRISHLFRSMSNLVSCQVEISLYSIPNFSMPFLLLPFSSSPLFPQKVLGLQISNLSSKEMKDRFIFYFFIFLTTKLTEYFLAELKSFKFYLQGFVFQMTVWAWIVLIWQTVPSWNLVCASFRTFVG